MTVELDALAAQVLDQYQGPEHASLQALIVDLLDLVDTLTAQITELKTAAGRHSANSSKPPSGDTLAQRQAQKQRRQEWTNKGNRANPSGERASSPVPRALTWPRWSIPTRPSPIRPRCAPDAVPPWPTRGGLHRDPAGLRHPHPQDRGHRACR
jgi:hypothetical protein